MKIIPVMKWLSRHRYMGHVRKLPRWVSLSLRLAVTLAAIALAFSQVNISQIAPMMLRIPVAILLAVILMLQAAQMLAALRSRFYLTSCNIRLPRKVALQLQYVGEMFSAVLPGGSAGDLYKAWWLKRYRQGKMLGMAKLMIGSRLNGLWVLGVVVCGLLLLGPVPRVLPHGYVLVVAALVAGTVGYGLLARFVFKETWRLPLQAATYSLVIQLLMVVGVWGLCVGLQIEADAGAYITLYLLSCVVALLPVSIGGIGVRELVLLQGCRLLHLNEESGVALAFTLTVLTLTIPLVGGVIYLLWKPKDAPEPDRAAL